MAGDHCLHGFTNRDIWARLASTQWLRSRSSDPTKARAKVGRSFRRRHAHGLIAKIPSTRRWWVTDRGRKGMGTTMYLRPHHFANVYAAVVHWTSSQETGKSQQENLSLSPFRSRGHSCAKLTKRLESPLLLLRQSTETRKEIRWPA
jgi:hypothetical protein